MYNNYDENLQLLGPLYFWQQYNKSFPLLSQVARSIFCIVVSSVPSESLFSIAGLIQTDQRNRLEPETLENLIFLKENLF